MYCKNVKSSTKINPNDNASQSSHAEYSRFVWGAERNLLLIAENLIHSLSVNSWRRARARIIQIHTDLTRNTACRNLWRMQARGSGYILANRLPTTSSNRQSKLWYTPITNTRWVTRKAQCYFLFSQHGTIERHKARGLRSKRRGTS